MIDEPALEKIAINLRGLSFLMESQVTSSIRSDDLAFKVFAYSVWKDGEMGSKKISAMQFWDKAIRILKDKKHMGEITFPLENKTVWGKFRTDTYGISLEINKSGNQVLKPLCESMDIPKAKAKSLKQVQNLWVTLQKEFIKESKKLSV